MFYELKCNLHINNQSNAIERHLNPSDINLPQGYKIEVFASGLDVPSGMVFTETGDMIIAQSGFGGRVANILRLRGGSFEVVAEGFMTPISGVNYHNGIIYVSHLGKITTIRPDGTMINILEGLPNFGDFWSSNVTFGADGKMYFGNGTATNSGVVGNDNLWVYDYPFFCDHVGAYVILNGDNFATDNILSNRGEVVFTGAFSPYGIPNIPFEIRKGIIKATGSILRANLDGSGLELYAWGLRFPAYARFDDGNRLFVSNQGYENRGSRPIVNAPDEFHIITQGLWYGWPDFAGGIPITSVRYAQDGINPNRFLITNHPNLPPRPIAILPSHSYVAGFDFNYNVDFGPYGEVYIAEFGGGGRIAPGERAPFVGAGHRISKININTGIVTTFAINRSGFPSYITGEGGFGRPINVMFGPDGAMYVLDFGVNDPIDLRTYYPNTGVIWKITRE